MCGVETRSLARLAGPHRHHPQPGAGDGGVLGVPQLGGHRDHVWGHGEHEDRQIIIPHNLPVAISFSFSLLPVLSLTVMLVLTLSF